MVFYAAHKGGAMQFSAGPPQGKLVPSGGSVLHEVKGVGAMQFSAGPPQGKLAPSGGSVLHEVKSMGAMKRLWIFFVFGTMHCSRGGELSTKFLCGF